MDLSVNYTLGLAQTFTLTHIDSKQKDVKLRYIWYFSNYLLTNADTFYYIKKVNNNKLFNLFSSLKVQILYKDYTTFVLNVLIF